MKMSAEHAHALARHYEVHGPPYEVIGCACDHRGECAVCGRYAAMTIAEIHEYNRRQRQRAEDDLCL